MSPRASAFARRERDHRWRTIDSEVCGRCGYLRINVAHNIDAQDQLEGPDYYESMAASLHEFVPTGRFQWSPDGIDRDIDGKRWLGRV